MYHGWRKMPQQLQQVAVVLGSSALPPQVLVWQHSVAQNVRCLAKCLTFLWKQNRICTRMQMDSLMALWATLAFGSQSCSQGVQLSDYEPYYP